MPEAFTSGALALLLTTGVRGTAVFAQTSGGDNTGTTTEQNDGGSGRCGLAGRLGLAGLTGLTRRDRRHDEADCPGARSGTTR